MMLPRTISRRTVLRMAGGGAVGLLLTACGDDDSPAQPTATPVASNGTNSPSATSSNPATTQPSGSTATTAPAPTVTGEPQVVSSVNGLLDTTLRLAPAMVPFGTTTRWALTVNGTTPGPTLRTKPGDRLRIVLDNQIGHSTNIHTHGLQVSPSGNSDNPFLEIQNGEQFTYEIDIPADHPGGLFWYHPHFHHHVAEQLFAGYFGAIIVEDDFDREPEVQAARERLILLHDVRPGTSESAVIGVTPMEQMQGREGSLVLVNGVQRPQLAAEAGTIERWRILNASPSRFYRLALQGHQMQVIGVDGGRTGSASPVDSLLLVPGERLEVLVQPSKAGTFTLSTAAVNRGRVGMGMGGGGQTTSAAADILDLVVSANGAEAKLPELPEAIEDLRDVQVDGSRELVFSMQGMSVLIDGRAFDGERIDIRGRLGTVEEWTIRNTSPMDHPFHLHIWPFQVMETSAGDGPAGWKDVVNIPAGGWVRFRLRFSGIDGKTVYHCHILDHEDMGMMGTIEVT